MLVGRGTHRQSTHDSTAPPHVLALSPRRAICAALSQCAIQALGDIGVKRPRAAPLVADKMCSLLQVRLMLPLLSFPLQPVLRPLDTHAYAILPSCHPALMPCLHMCIVYKKVGSGPVGNVGCGGGRGRVGMWRM